MHEVRHMDVEEQAPSLNTTRGCAMNSSGHRDHAEGDEWIKNIAPQRRGAPIAIEGLAPGCAPSAETGRGQRVEWTGAKRCFVTCAGEFPPPRQADRSTQIGDIVDQESHEAAAIRSCASTDTGGDSEMPFKP